MDESLYTTAVRLCGGTVVCLICLLVLRHTETGKGKGTADAVGIAFSVLLGGVTLRLCIPVLEKVRELCTPYVSGGLLDTESARILWQSVAVGMTVQFTADLLRDAGEGALASKLELCGRALLLCLGLPLAEKLFALAGTLLEG